jgi:transcriptional regulator with XRE-family HTH domain
MEAMDELTPGSPVRRWRLGKQLREIREHKGVTVEQAANYIGVKAPTLSRIELGRHTILPRNVKFLCQLYEVGAPEVDTLMRQAEESTEQGWWLAFSDTMPSWFKTYVGFEADAKEIWSYQNVFVPGLLQTEGYVRAANKAYENTPTEDEMARSVEFRLTRQKRLNTKPPTMRLVLHESVVRLCGDYMPEQIQHLVDMSKNSYLDLRVLTSDSGMHRAMKGSFSLLTLPDEPAPNFVYLEHENGAIYMERPSDLARYTDGFEHLVAGALSPRETRKFLTSLVP